MTGVFRFASPRDPTFLSTPVTVQVSEVGSNPLSSTVTFNLSTLDAFTERGDPSTALRYGEQDITTTTGSLGVTMRYDQPTSFGIVSPELRLEYQHDFGGTARSR